MAKEIDRTLYFILRDELIPGFFPLLEQGFSLRVLVGCSIRDFLCGQLGLQGEYLDNRIQTLFLNGKAVDDVDSTLVNDGAVLALSAAMPGIMGACLRKGGLYAPMRSNISREKRASDITRQYGEVVIKLFNLVLKELGPVFFEYGILTCGDKVRELLSKRQDEFRTGISSARLADEDIDFDDLLKKDWGGRIVFFKLAKESI
ncbi:hypothetical protein BuS5_02148 [Desulfosarcina sp. BuS5]|uniref:hypothetical protein n=1 Tax=Desulfosarcina sp. BuS5 TaxID=933262 RepID=UPI00048A1973|nr:hypothetical protein [Desulfosarcina sp. BuS5]WDN89180.1 hypothetical protein BuS5_02148 [Desulfosarcina sp. BuS5]